MNTFLRSSAALGVFAMLGTGGCTGAYVTAQLLTDESAGTSAPSGLGQSSLTSSNPNYSCSATNCSLGAVASSPAYPPMMLAVAKTTTIISLSDDPVTDRVALASAAQAIKGGDSGAEFAEQ
jgi:hypothetical protein